MDVDFYLKDFISAVALDTAFKTGIIDHFIDGGKVSISEIGIDPVSNSAGGRLLLGMLIDADVCEVCDNERYCLTTKFTSVIATHRTILEQKLTFLLLAAGDLLNGMPDLLFDLPRFMEKSRTFSLFRYDKAMGVTSDNLAHTRLWVDYVAALTEAEADVLLPKINLTDARRLLEIGGNVGAFARHLLRAYPEIKISIFDLPAVCALGEDYNADPLDKDRLTFVAGDARVDPWPQVGGMIPDAILFKSVLHDWPEKDARHLLDRATDSLDAGGQIIICERGPMIDELGRGEGALPFSMATNLVFSPFYRPATFYQQELELRGYEDISILTIQAEMAFNIISARKKDML